MKSTAVYALTPRGAQLGKTISDQMKADFFLPSAFAADFDAIPFTGMLRVVKKNFSLYLRHIFIASAGIVVRAISPHLASKYEDPAVVVLDQEGKFCISLISGHLGGANRLAKEVAELTKGIPVITTATDSAGIVSLDMLAKEKKLKMLNPKAVKHVSMALLSDKPVMIFDANNSLGLKNKDNSIKIIWISREEDMRDDLPGVRVTFKAVKNPSPGHLILHPKCLIAGVGCNRGTNEQEILEFIANTFEEKGFSLHSLKCLVSIVNKNDEPGLLSAAKKMDVPVIFLVSDELKTIKPPHESYLVEKHIGVKSVCEAAAMFVSGNKKLLVPKLKTRNVTLSIALGV
ncbi:MAG: cobalamin biosynthesis protein [Desulfobacterales bacterium]